jgi:hypothetical protein
MDVVLTFVRVPNIAEFDGVALSRVVRGKNATKAGNTLASVIGGKKASYAVSCMNAEPNKTERRPIGSCNPSVLYFI